MITQSPITDWGLVWLAGLFLANRPQLTLTNCTKRSDMIQCLIIKKSDLLFVPTREYINTLINLIHSCDQPTGQLALVCYFHTIQRVCHAQESSHTTHTFAHACTHTLSTGYTNQRSLKNVRHVNVAVDVMAHGKLLLRLGSLTWFCFEKVCFF